MNRISTIAIESIYCGRTTEVYKPLYAKHETFVRKSKYDLYFYKENGVFTEILTGTKISSVIDNITEAKPGVISLISPRPVEKKRFSKVELEQGTVSTKKKVIDLYKNQEAVLRENNKKRNVKVKTLM